MDLFKVENHVAVIDPEIRAIPEFRKIITRDKDRYKKKAYAELIFIYFCYHYKSPLMKYTDELKFTEAKKKARLPEGWKPDEDLNRAIEVFKELTETETMLTLRNVRRGLITSNALIKRINEDFTATIASDDFDVEYLSKAVVALLDLSQKIPKQIAIVEELQKKVAEQQASTGKIRGARDKGDYEDPD